MEPRRDARPRTAAGAGPDPSPAPERSPRPGTIVQRGRAKAYRPLPPERRREILEAGLAAYARGDFFLAHELLEPAWMGASEPGERDLYQGLIKLAAAYVHGVRGNPVGVRKNLAGARVHLADAIDAGAVAGIDVDGLVTAVDERLVALGASPAGVAQPAPEVTRRREVTPRESSPGPG